MKEIEILVKVASPKCVVLKALKKFTSDGVKTVKDTYFFHPHFPKTRVNGSQYPTEWLRLRESEEYCTIAYKKDHLSRAGTWRYSDEHETKVSDWEAMKNIVAAIGWKELVQVENRKHVFLTEKYEIVLEEVKGLGLFLEVEQLKVPPDGDVEALRAGIWKFICSLGITVSPELHVGKPELMLRKQG